MVLKSSLPDSALDINYHRFEFIHIPKCGGTSIHRRLAEVLGSGYSYGRKFLQDAKAAIALSQGHKVDPVAKEKSFSILRSTLLGAGAHVPCGQNPINKIAPNGIVMVRFAIVRHPLERLASLRRHCLDHPRHKLNQQLSIPTEATLKEFILANINDPEIVNPQANQLMGPYTRKSGEKPSGELLKRLVQECIIDAVFSMTELKQFYEYMNNRIPGFGEISTHNASRSTLDSNQIEEARELVEECCRTDHEIYSVVTRGS